MTLVVMEYDNTIPNSSATAGYSKANRADNRFIPGLNLGNVWWWWWWMGWNQFWKYLFLFNSVMYDVVFYHLV